MLPSPRPAVDRLPAYRPGKGAAQAEAEHGITNAIKLASNENPDAPLDSIVAAVSTAAAAPIGMPIIGPRPCASDWVGGSESMPPG